VPEAPTLTVVDSTESGDESTSTEGSSTEPGDKPGAHPPLFGPTLGGDS